MTWIFTDEMRFYLHDGETLLDGMIRTQHRDVRYMCRQGFCGACKMKVKGMTHVPKYKQIALAHLKDNEVLACCCMPTGTMVVSYKSDPDNDDGQVCGEMSGHYLQKTSIITQ